MPNMKKLAQDSVEVRSNGVSSSVELSSYRKLIDEWLVKYRWSPSNIARELHRLHPNEEHPSRSAIERYKKSQLPKSAQILNKEFSRGISEFETVQGLIESIKARYNPGLASMVLSSNVSEKLDRMHDYYNELLDAAGPSEWIKHLKEYVFLLEKAQALFQRDLLIGRESGLYGESELKAVVSSDKEGGDSVDSTGEILSRVAQMARTVAQYVPGGPREHFDPSRIKGEVNGYGDNVTLE